MRALRVMTTRVWLETPAAVAPAPGRGHQWIQRQELMTCWTLSSGALRGYGAFSPLEAATGERPPRPLAAPLPGGS